MEMRVSVSENFKIWRWIGFLFFRIKKSSGGEVSLCQDRSRAKAAAFIPDVSQVFGIRERPLKADKDRKFIIESHFAGRKSLM